MNERDIQNVAIAEILNPTLENTQHYLKSNKIVLKDNTPYVEDVILREREKVAEVYFPIEGERYYLIVYIDLEPSFSVRQVNISAGNRVYFYAKSAERHSDELIALAGIEPTSSWEKGKNGRLPKHNGFRVQLSSKGTGEVEDKLRTLIRALLPYKVNLQSLSTLATLGVNIVYWGHKDQMQGIHFDEEIIQGLAELNLSVDVDLYAGGSDFDAR